ncbi:hypothetical protein ACVWY5_001256 [Bradyrhizobium sp. USDA 3256]
MEAGAARPVAQCRPIKPDALARIDLGLTVKGVWSPNLETITCAMAASVGSPPGTTCSGACACTTGPEQRRQMYFGRRVTSTRHCAGITSRRWLTSSPIFVMAPQPQGQSVLAGSMTRSTRGKWAGKQPRLR